MPDAINDQFSQIPSEISPFRLEDLCIHISRMLSLTKSMSDISDTLIDDSQDIKIQDHESVL